MKPFEPEPLPPAEIDWMPLLPLLGKANRAIATFDGLLYGIPNPDVLLSPLTTQEAVLSSKIEGTQADFEDVLLFEAGEEPEEPARKEDVREILNYRKALNLSVSLMKERPFCLATLLKLHEVLLDSVRGYNKARGRIRTTQNWIGPQGCTLEEASFVPPSPLGLQDHLNLWEAYWHAEEQDILAQLAVIHAQFEILHPFLDGNGRVGRMVIPLFLYERGVLSRPCFYLSAYFEENRDDYIAHLRALGSLGSWGGWCAFFLKGIVKQAEENTRKAKAIHDLYEDLKKRVLDLTHSQYAIPLLDYTFQRPIFRSNEVAKLEHMPSSPMVSTLLKTLREHGILKTLRKGAGRRPHILALHELINLCEGRKVI